MSNPTEVKPDEVRGWNVRFIAISPRVACEEIERQAPEPYKEALKGIVKAMESEDAFEMQAEGDFTRLAVVQVQTIPILKH